MSTTRDDAFYVGYLPEAPSTLARWLRPRVVGLVLLAAGLAAALAFAQAPFARATFEFGTETTLEGTVFDGAAPWLEVQRPGGGNPSNYLLVGLGKHGATDALRGLDGSPVEVTGTLIYRGGMTMLEVAEGGVRQLAQGSYSIGGMSNDGSETTLRGEIVDSKCFLGVMKPGNLKPHRACAVRCISGGVPPLLLVRDVEGSAAYFLLVGPAGQAINQDVLPYVAEPVEVRGQLSGGYIGYPTLKVDPTEIRRLP